MRRMIAGFVVVAAAAAPAAAGRLPLIGGKEAVASVNDEPITVDEMMERLGSMHAALDPAASPPARPDPAGVLQRIIDARLIVQEAKRIGLDQDPEVRARLDAGRLGLVKSAVIRAQVNTVVSPDPAEVERIYRAQTREVTFASVLFKSEADARAFADAATKARPGFDDLAKSAVAAGQATKRSDAITLKAGEMRPEMARAADLLQPDQVSAPFALDGGFAVIRLVGTRQPEDPEARRRAQDAALNIRKQARLDEYSKELRARYARVDETLFKSLDFESKTPGLERLRQDARVVATIKGGRPITVKDLTARVEETFYHGIQDAIERKRVNVELPQTLDRLILERATLLEAKRLGVEKSDDFQASLKEETDSVLFDTFVQKVVNPGIKIADPELKTYYDAHAADFTSPEMVRLDGLAFVRPADAESAAERLRRGTELAWLKANASGQAKAEDDPAAPAWSGGLVTVASLPEGMRRALEGAAAGDVRLDSEPRGPHYVLVVRERHAAAAQPLAQVRQEVAVKVFEARRKSALDDWVAKLRAASRIAIYAEGSDLRRAVGLGPAATH